MSSATAFVSRPALPADVERELQRIGVPLVHLEAACRGCAAELDDDVEDYPKGFDVDLSSEMLGSVNAYGRMCLISSGASDWQREVTDSGFPSYVKEAYAAATAGTSAGSTSGGFFGKLSKKIQGSGSSTSSSAMKGIYPILSSTPTSTAPGTPVGTAPSSPSEPPRLSILSSSLLSSGHDGEESVIVLPDYKIVHGVADSVAGAAALVHSHLDPSLGRAGRPAGDTGDDVPSATSITMKSYPLPYAAVVLICSHKRRDKRCHIAAPLLINQFHHHLDQHGLEVDERGDDLSDGPSIEEYEGDDQARESRLEESLKGVKRNGGRVAVFKVSHIGGHRYAGNVLVCLPNGTATWYGRVTPRDVGAIVNSTIIQGKVIPELLRGGLGLTGKDGPEGLLSW